MHFSKCESEGSWYWICLTVSPSETAGCCRVFSVCVCVSVCVVVAAEEDQSDSCAAV